MPLPQILNFDIKTEYLLDVFKSILNQKKLEELSKKSKEIIVEFSSPNTNKPLHLGHLRNIFLGDSISKIYEALGYKVHKVQIINDRGIHICKSMVAWSKFGAGKTPDSEKLKGDKFVGDFYVKFEKELKKEIKKLCEKGLTEDDALKQSKLMLEAKSYLKKWFWPSYLASGGEDLKKSVFLFNKIIVFDKNTWVLAILFGLRR